MKTGLGGAANVARNIKSLGADPILCTIIGNDNRGKQFERLMEQEGLSTKGVLVSNNRKTTVKTRIISDQKHQLRVDEEDTYPIMIEEEFMKIISNLMRNVNVIILQDYNKGVLTPNIINQVIKKANNKNILTIVDPKKQNFNLYKNCTIFKPNLKEIKDGIQLNFDEDNQNELHNACELLREKLNANGVLLTLSDKGICIKTQDTFLHIPAFQRNIIDVSGAGDTVISVASLLLSAGINYNDLSKISALAGGLVCEKVGVVPIDKETLLEETKKTYK